MCRVVCLAGPCAALGRQPGPRVGWRRLLVRAFGAHGEHMRQLCEATCVCWVPQLPAPAISPAADTAAAADTTPVRRSIFLGTFMASFDLRAFPFDTQRLHVQMEVPGWAGGNIVLKPSSAGTRLFNTNPGVWGRWWCLESLRAVRGGGTRDSGAKTLTAADADACAHVCCLPTLRVCAHTPRRRRRAQRLACGPRAHGDLQPAPVPALLPLLQPALCARRPLAARVEHAVEQQVAQG
jgi:hypothetical protein